MTQKYSMKIYIPAILAVLLIALIFAACTNNASDEAQSTDAGEKNISVVTTIFAPYDFVWEITSGSGIEFNMLLPPGSESHSFEPTPQDIIRIQNCTLFIYVGGESDHWVKEVLSSMDSDKRTLALIDCVKTVEEEIVPGMEVDENENPEHEPSDESDDPEYDEHVWTSPENAKRIVQMISDALCAADAEHVILYRENTVRYLAELDSLDAAFRDVTEHAKRKTIVFGDRFPFRYLTDAYGLTYYAAYPGCSTETEASAATIKFLIDKINDEKIPVVFHIELSNEKMADAIGEATGADVLLLHAVHNISREDFLSGVGYLDLMYQNAEHLRKALS